MHSHPNENTHTKTEVDQKINKNHCSIILRMDYSMFAQIMILKKSMSIK